MLKLKQTIEDKNKNHEEMQYINLINNILNKGSLETGRNGNVYTLFGNSMRFNLKDNTVPILTSKKVAWKTCLKELLWFISGSTDNRILKKQNVKIWNENGSREFLDSRGLTNLNEDDLGPVYGHQWRHFNAEYTSYDSDYTNEGVDQLKYIIDALKNPNERTSRRLIMSAWNPIQINEMALPPCHVLCQFNVVRGNELSCALYQRSGDIGLGVPFNIASYSMLTHIIAHHCDLIASEFIYFLGNTHIYDNHVDALIQQTNIIKDIELPNFPKFFINKNTSYHNINDYKLEDFELMGYSPAPTIKMEMRK